MVARNDDHLGAGGEGLPELAEQRPGKRHRSGCANLAELEHIAEDHQPVEVAQNVQEPGAGHGMAKNVAALESAEVKVREHSGPHRHIIPPGRTREPPRGA